MVSEAVKKSELSTISDSNLITVDSIVFEDSIEEIKLSLEALNKTLTGGNYDVAPSALSGGAALQISSSMKNKIKAAVRDWDRTRPLAEVIKAALPEVSDEYLDYFTNQAQDLSLKKGEPVPFRISPKASDNVQASPAQKELIEGIYPDLQKIANKKSQVLKNDAGKLVSVVPVKQPPTSTVCPARAATAYQDIAHEVFGLGDNVPVTNHFTDPNGNVLVASERPDGAKSALDPTVNYPKILEKMAKSGLGQKLLLLDAILSHRHRNLGNILVNRQGQPVMIDNTKAFSAGQYQPQRAFPDDSIWSAPIHNDVATWLATLDPRKLAQLMAKHKFDPDWIHRVLYGLRVAQNHAAHGHPFSAIIQQIAQGSAPQSAVQQAGVQNASNNSQV